MVEWIYKLTDISNIKRISFRQDINGLRAIAVLAVVFYHAELELFKGGWLGVDIFFVISGYLISNIIISELNAGTFSFKKFYLRRIKRILPVFYFISILTSFIAIFSFNSEKLVEYSKSLLASLSFVSNIYFSNLDFYTYDPIKYSFLVHTWSLAIEEQFYLFFPIVLFIIFKYLKSKTFIFLSSIAIVSFLLNILNGGQDKFYFLQYRIWEFIAGCVVMIISQNIIKSPRTKVVGIFLILFSILYFNDDWILDIEPKFLAIIGTMFFLLDKNENSKIDFYLSFKTFSIIGISSYSMYLLHQPMFAIIRIFKDSFNRGGLTVWDKGISILVLILISNVFYKKIEIIYIKEKSKHNVFRFLLKNSFIILIFALLVLTTNGFYSRYDSSDYNSEHGGLGNIDEIVLLGNISTEPKFVLVGDSHADHYSKSLDEYGKNYNFSFYKYTRGNCLSLINYTNTYKFGLEGYDRCVSLFKSALAKAEELDVPIVYGNFWIYDIRNNTKNNITKWSERDNPFDLIRDELMLSFNEYNIPKIYIIGKTIGSNNIPFSKPIKCSNENGNKKIIFFNLKLKDSFNLCLDFKQQANVNINNAIRNSIQNLNKLIFINPVKIYCDESNCIDFLNNDYIYYDSHLSYKGSKLLTLQLLNELNIEK